MKEKRSRKVIAVAVSTGILIAAILIIGTLWSGHKARQDTEKAVSSVSLFYLDELAGRREQVVSSALKKNIKDLKTAVGLMTADDLDDIEHLQDYQARMKKLYTLDKFAFVDTDGTIYTALGTQDNIGEYNIDYKNITEPQITIKDNSGAEHKKVIIAVPVDNLQFTGRTLVVCFMEIDMDTMLEGVNAHLSKPIDNDALFDVLEKLIQ